MFKVVQTSTTPNPNALKFHLDKEILESGSKSFSSPADSQGLGAVESLFELKKITSVFFISNIVTINKKPDGNWDELIPKVADIIEGKLKPIAETVLKTDTKENATSSQQPGNQPNQAPNDSSNSSLSSEDFFSRPKEDQIKAINQILDTSVRPGLAGDGGGLALLDLKGNQVEVHYEGACGSCPSATEGTLHYIENTLKETLSPNLTVVIA